MARKAADLDLSTASLSVADVSAKPPKHAANRDLITLQCGERTWEVSKSAFSAHSEFFKGALKGHWKESTVGIIHLEDDHPTAIEAMVNFVCTEGTNYPVVSSDASYLSLEVHVRIYNLADKYNIVLLAQLAAEAFLTFEARDAPPSDLHFVIRELYDNSPDNPTTLKMKTRLVAACVEHEKALTNDPKHVQFREVFAEIIPFALAFQQAVIAMDTLKELEILDAHPKSTRDPEVRIDCQNPRCAEDFVMRWSKGWSGDRYWCPFCGVQFTRTSYQERITD